MRQSSSSRILGTPLAMVSPKAQATRIPVTGIHTEGDTQIVIRDLPGLLDPAYLMQQSMRQMALEALRDVNVVVHLHPASEAPAPEFATLVADAPPFTARVLTVYTNADMVSPSRRAGLVDTGASVVSINEAGSVRGLLQRIRSMLPEVPFQHDPDDIGTQPVRFFVGEYLREAAFNELGEEVPYSFAAEVDEFRENPKPVYIRARLHERESQKGILIGHKGATLKKIGAHARGSSRPSSASRSISRPGQGAPEWRRSATALARFGFPVPDDEKT